MSTHFDFDTVAEEYDEYYESDYGKRVDFYEKQAVARQLSSREGWKVLEVGCGTGHWTSFFLEFGYQITAIDLSENMIEVARAKKLEDVRYEIADAADLPYESNSFDQVFTVATLEFIKEREKAVKEIQRVLKNGGYFLAGCLNQNSILGDHKEEDPVFKDAEFFTPEALYELLSLFGEPVIRGSVMPDEDGNMKDHVTDEATLRENGCFLVGSVKLKN